eukprot:Gb_08883 [translate_table: standard]
MECNIDVHAANKLTNKHGVRLSYASVLYVEEFVDGVQEKVAIVFCVEDRALLCHDCDEPIHAPGTLATKHQRLLSMGIRVALNEESMGPPQESNPPPTIPPPCKSFFSSSTLFVQSIKGSANESPKKASFVAARRIKGYRFHLEKLWGCHHVCHSIRCRRRKRR